LGDAGRLLSRLSHRRGFCALAALAFAGLSVFAAAEAAAGVVVEGGRDEVRVNVENDSLGQVLDALSQKENLRYRSTVPLNKIIGGSFSGSLGYILSRILVGFDFVVVYHLQGVEIFIYGESGAKSAPPQPIGARQPRTASTGAEQAGSGISLAPSYLPPPALAFRGPNKYDLATSNLSMHR
jgi:hypothetical protein